jgi:hypothetical protein
MDVETLKLAIDDARKKVTGLPEKIEDRHLVTAANSALRYYQWARTVGRDLDDVFKWAVRDGVRTLTRLYSHQKTRAENIRRDTPVGTLTEQYIVEKADELQEQILWLKEKHWDNLSLEQRQDVRTIEEEMSSGDWNRFGVFYGVLWYKVDKMIRALEAIQSNTKK